LTVFGDYYSMLIIQESLWSCRRWFPWWRTSATTSSASVLNPRFYSQTLRR